MLQRLLDKWYTPHAPRSKFEILRGKEDKWYYHLVGGNGEIMYSSELYISREHAERGAHDAQRATIGARIVVID